MLSEEKAAEVFALISKGRKPWTTVRVWFAVTFSTNYDNWAVTADVPALSAKAGVPEAEVRRALGALTRMGALIRMSRGRYAVNPHVSWRGTLQERRKAQAAAPDLRVV
jgi:hypothetical protein